MLSCWVVIKCNFWIIYWYSRLPERLLLELLGLLNFGDGISTFQEDKLGGSLVVHLHLRDVVFISLAGYELGVYTMSQSRNIASGLQIIMGMRSNSSHWNYLCSNVLGKSRFKLVKSCYHQHKIESFHLNITNCASPKALVISHTKIRHPIAF